MDMKQLRALVTVAETGNVTRASAILNIVQPAVSRQIKMLEEDVGTALFERGRHGMELTESGHILVEHARRILNEVARARAEIRPTGGEIGGLVTVGLLSSTAELLSGAWVTRMARDYPAIRVRVTVGYGGHLQRWMDAGELDAALHYDVRQSATTHVKPLLSEGLWVVAHPSAGLKVTKPVTMKHAAAGRFVLPSAPHGLRTLIEEAAGVAGVELDVAVEVNELNAQKKLVMEGIGCTILPAIAVASDVAAGRLCAAPLKNPTVERRIVLAVPTAHPSSAAVRVAMDALVDCMREAVAEGRWPAATWLAD